MKLLAFLQSHSELICREAYIKSICRGGVAFTVPKDYVENVVIFLYFVCACLRAANLAEHNDFIIFAHSTRNQTQEKSLIYRSCNLFITDFGCQGAMV